jgi:hypothetical protein
MTEAEARNQRTAQASCMPHTRPDACAATTMPVRPYSVEPRRMVSPAGPASGSDDAPTSVPSATSRTGYAGLPGTALLTARPAVLRSQPSSPSTAAAMARMPNALGCTGAAGAVGTRPSIHFVPGSVQMSCPMNGV